MIIRPRINLCREHYREAVNYKKPEVQDEVFIKDNSTCDVVNCCKKAVFKVSITREYYGQK